MKDITFISGSGQMDNSISKFKMTVAGREKLAHEVCKALLTLYGSSEFDPEYGSGFSHLVEYNYTDDDELRSLMTTVVKEAERSVLKNQAGQSLPPEETLQSLEVGEVKFDEREGAVIADVYVVNLLGTVYNMKVSTV